MKMPQIIVALGWLLVMSAAAVLLLGSVLPACFLDALKNAVPAGVLIALAGNLFTQGKNVGDAAEKRSAFFLDSTEKAYEQARFLLDERSYDRATWIEAARCLGHAKSLAEGVTLDAHK